MTARDGSCAPSHCFVTPACISRHPGMMNVLDRFTDGRGAPLRSFSRSRLAALLADPRPATWDDAHGLVVNASGLTLWQAWIAIDPTAPTTGRHITLDPDDRVVVLREWDRVPDDAMLQRIVEYALREG